MTVWKKNIILNLILYIIWNDKMIILVCFLLFIVWFFFGVIFMWILCIRYYEDKFFNDLVNFENRIDFSFEKYFWFSLFPEKK